jgi:hypothetical protein
MKRKSYSQMCAHYSKFLPAGVAPINDPNLANHKHHSDPELAATQILLYQNRPVTPADSLKQLYEIRFAEEINRKELMDHAYRARLELLDRLNSLMADKTHELDQLKRDCNGPGDLVAKAKIDKSVDKLIELIDRLLDKQESLQNTALKHDITVSSKYAKDPREVNAYFINRFSSRVGGLMAEFGEKLMTYLVGDVFRDDQAKGAAILRHIADLMDGHIMQPLERDLRLAEAKKPDANASYTIIEDGASGDQKFLNS